MPKVRGELSEVHGEQVWFSTMDLLFRSQPAENVHRLALIFAWCGCRNFWESVCVSVRVSEAGPDLPAGL